MRNLFILGCAALLAFGLSFGAFAGSIQDVDNDGVPDNLDNCQVVANGPLLSVSGCGQFDVDQDGYGNACDADISNNGVVDLPDIGAVLGGLGGSSPLLDISCNGVVDLPDIGAVLGALGQSAGVAPFLSGLGCAGSIPCLN